MHGARSAHNTTHNHPLGSSELPSNVVLRTEGGAHYYTGIVPLTWMRPRTLALGWKCCTFAVNPRTGDSHATPLRYRPADWDMAHDVGTWLTLLFPSRPPSDHVYVYIYIIYIFLEVLRRQPTNSSNGVFII